LRQPSDFAGSNRTATTGYPKQGRIGELDMMRLWLLLVAVWASMGSAGGTGWTATAWRASVPPVQQEKGRSRDVEERKGMESCSPLAFLDSFFLINVQEAFSAFKSLISKSKMMART